MKKSLVLVFIIFLSSIISFKIKALENYKNINSVTDVKYEEVTPGLDFNQYTINSFDNKTKASTDKNVYTYTLKSGYSNLKLATWTYASQNGYKNVNLMEIAKDYEKNHPGYKVLGGINTEGYVASKDKNSVYELTNAFVQDGYVLRKDISNEETKEMIALMPNGNHVIKRVPEVSDNPWMYVENEHLEIKYVDSLPSGNEIGVLTPALSTSINLSGYNVYKCYYDLYRRTSNFPGGCLTGANLGIFFKGHIIGKENIDSINKVDLTYFYIVTKKDIDSFMINGKDVLVQFDYLDEFGEVESAVGYWFKYLENGVVCDENYQVYLEEEGRYAAKYGSHDYWSSIYKERAGIGFKENGDVVILASNRGTGGPSQYEVGQYFKMLGCTDAYQFDGGGSVTFIKRNEMGEFDMLNTPADGVARSIISGLFIVVKDIEIDLDVKAIENGDAQVKATLVNTLGINVNDVLISIDGAEMISIINEASISNLKGNSTYSYEIYYKIQGDNKIYKSFSSGSFIMPYLKGYLEYIKYRINDDSIKVDLKFKDPDNTISKVFIRIGDDHYFKVDDSYSFTLNGEYELFDLSIRYELNDGVIKETVLLDKDEITIDASINEFLYSLKNTINNTINEILK